MKTTKLFAVAFVLMMLGAASVCVFVPQEVKASESANELTDTVVFDPAMGDKAEKNTTALAAINNAKTAGNASMSMDESTFVLTLTDLTLNIKAKSGIQFEPTKGEYAVKLVIDGNCTINHTYDEGEKDNGKSNTQTIGATDGDYFLTSLSITGKGSLNINVILPQDCENTVTAIQAIDTPLSISPSKGQDLTINISGEIKSETNVVTKKCVDGIVGILDINSINLNIETKGNVRLGGLIIDHSDNQKTASIANSVINIHSEWTGYGLDMQELKKLTITGSYINVYISGSTTNGDSEDEEAGFITGYDKSTGTSEETCLELNKSTVFVEAPFGIVHKGDTKDAYNLSVNEKEGSLLSLNSSKNAVIYHNEGTAYAKTIITFSLSNSELECIGAVKMFELDSDTYLLFSALSPAIKLSAKGDDPYSETTDIPFVNTNNKAFVGYKYDLLFYDSETKDFLKMERVNYADGYTFANIPVGEKTYNRFNDGTKEYKTDEKYTLASKTVPYIDFTCSEETEPVELTLEITSPEAGATVTTSTITVTGTVTGATKLQYKLDDGSVQDVTSSITGTTFSFQITDLTFGAHNIAVSASAGGSPVAKAISVFYNDGKTPFVKELTPSPSEAVKAEKFSIAGKVLNAKKVTIVLNGGEEKVLTLGEDGSFSTDVTLKSGANNIEVKVYGSEKVITKTITVTYDDGGSEDEGKSFWDTPGNIAGTVVLGISLLTLLGLIVFERTRKL